MIDLTNNQLTGNIPSQLGRLTNLQALYLSSNQLDGAIPSELGNMAGLIRLDLSKNRLSGAIPETLVNLSKILDQGNDPRLILDFNRLTVPVPYPSVPPTPLEDFLKLKNPDWYLTQSAQTVIPTSGGSLISQDGNITITFPENAVTAPTTFEIIPQPTPQNPTGSLYETPRHNFQINALDSGGIPLPNYTFSNPVTVLLEYTDADIANLEETRLNLYFWDRATSQWKDAATSCSPISVYTRDLEQNRLSVGICHLSEFSLLSTGTKIYLPLLMK